MDVPTAVEQQLKGTLKKFTVRVLFKDGRALDWQTDDELRLDWEDKAQACFLNCGYSMANSARISEVIGWTTTPNTNGE